MSTGPGAVPTIFAAALADRYRVERELGRGGMATVYLAHDLRHDRQVAIKVLHEDLGATLGPERFLAEIKTTARLQHPHILPLLDSGEAGGRLFYVMPYVEGETLRSRLTRETQLPIEDAVRIAREVADALGFAHGHGIVHRDIKPENILLQGGHALVADFGIALAVQQAGGTRMTQTGLSLGTPQYMSPEQAMGEKTVDHRGDIYALGAVTYEMLTGDPPFTGSSVQAIVAKVLSSEPEPLTTTRRTIPPNVEAAVLTALAKLPADRFAGATQFAEALQRPGFATVGSRPAPGIASGRARTQRAVTMSALAVGVAGLAIAAWSLSRPSAAANAEPRFFDIALPDSSPVALTGPATLGIWQRAIAVSPDGKAIAYIALKSGGVTRLAVRHLDSDQWQEYPGTEGAFFPFFSPNGQRVGFFVGTDLRTVAVAGGAVSVVATGMQLPVGAAWVSPESILVADHEGNKPTWFSPSGRAPDDLPRACGRLRAIRCHVMDPQVATDRRAIIGASWNVLTRMSLPGGEVSVPENENPDAVADSASGAVLRGAGFRVLPSGRLLFAAGTELRSIGFDATTGRVSGAMFTVLDGVRLETTYLFSQFALGDDGTLAYIRGPDSRLTRLAWIDAAGRRDLVNVPAGIHAFINRGPAPGLASFVRSTDGAREVIVVDTRDGRQVRSIPFGVDELPVPVWHPEGGLLINTTDSTGSRRWASHLPGLTSARLLPVNGVTGRVIAISPESRWMVLTTRDDSAMVRDLRDTVAAPVVAPAGIYSSFSPDGRWLATSESAKIVVLPIPYDGRRFEIAPEGEQPRWFPDGKRLAFRQRGEIMVVDLLFRGGNVEAGRPRRFVEGRFPRIAGWAYDIGHDGRILAFVNDDEVSASVIRIVTNFPELVRRKALEAKPR